MKKKYFIFSIKKYIFICNFLKVLIIFNCNNLEKKD